MTPETRGEVAAILMQIQDLVGAIAVVIAEDPTEQPAPKVASDDQTLCEHPDDQVTEFGTGQQMCMACGLSRMDDGPWAKL